MDNGFSLIELLCTCVIIGLIVSISYPSYLMYITHARRTEGQLALLDLANHMEKHYLKYGTYQSATVGNTLTSGGWYSLSISNATTQDYQLQATAKGQQAIKDRDCKLLTLNNLGEKGSKECW